MKIGIATFQWADNYGALLQAFALQNFLQKSGHNIEIINFQPRKEKKWLNKWIGKSPQKMLRKWESAYKSDMFAKFRKEFLTRTKEPFYNSEDLQSLSNRYDLLITGSDQVWNPKWLSQAEGLFDFCFLSFGGSNTKRISYAASIGHSSTYTMTEEWQSELKERILKIDAISVREKSSIKLIEELCDRKDAVCTLDPTLLLERHHYEKVFKLKKVKKNILFSFMLHGLEKDAVNINNYISSNLKIQEIKCNAKKTVLHKGYTLPTVASWLQKINEAKFVVTNSFHCVVFCLIFHTPFIVILIDGEIGSMNYRIIDILEAVDLSDRMIFPKDTNFHSLVNKNVEWGKVDIQMKNRRKLSIDFLKTNVGTIS